MFSLVVVIVSIALVIALVVVGGFYGGSSILDSQARTEATRLKNEEQQILGAVDMFKADRRRWPSDIDELVGQGYLRSIPRGIDDADASRFELMSTAYAQLAGLGWTPPVIGQPIYMTAFKVPQSVCRHYNFVSRGDDGILRAPYNTLQAQCYGSDGNYRVVVKKLGADVSLSDALGSALDGGLPMGDGGDAWWDTPPKGEVQAPIDPEKTPTALLTLSSSSFDFGAVPVGSTSPARTLTLTNTGNRELTGLGGYSAPVGFAIERDLCSSSLAVGASCTLDIVFRPALQAEFEGAVSFSSSSPQSAAVSLKGSATMAALTSSIDWTQHIGTGPALAKHYAHYVLTNEGNLPVQLNSLTVTQGVGFAEVGTCVLGSSLAPNASCSVDVGFPATQDASPNLLVGAVLSTSAGDKTFTVDGSSAQLTWTVVSEPADVVPGKAHPVLLRLKNEAPTAFVFGGGNSAQGKFNVVGDDWAVASSTCAASLPGGEACEATLSLTAVAADVDRPVTLAPVGVLQDFVNRTEVASGASPKALASFMTSARATRVDFSALVASMVNPTISQGVSDATAGAYYSLASGVTNSLPVGTWSMGRTVTIPDSSGPVQAKLRYVADDSVTSLLVNGQAVTTPSPAAGVQLSSEFTLLPGVNTITWNYRNDTGAGAFAVQIVRSSDGGIVAPSSGWKYAGTAVLVSVFHDGTVYRYADGTVAESCQAYKWPAAGYAVAQNDGQYRILGGAATVYCDQTHNQGGWTLVMTNNLPNFTNRSGIGTPNVCLTPTGCNTGGTSNVYIGTPVAAKISQYMFTATNSGNIWQMVDVFDRPANFVRDNTPAPGLSLYTLMTDGALGWAPAAAVGIPGDENNPARQFAAANGGIWSDGNWFGQNGVQGMQAVRTFNWGHHNYNEIVMENGMYRVGPYTHMPFFDGPGVKYIPPYEAENLYRWTIFVR